MEEKIQLRHPARKKAIKMDKDKYEILKVSIINLLKKNGESNHQEMLEAVNSDLKKNKTKFEGTVEWYMEWVKLDLEAGKQIIRSLKKSPITFTLPGK